MLKMNRMAAKAAALSAVSISLLLAAAPASAHCDGMDGPVIQDARQALDSGDVKRVLIWVQPQEEAQIRAAFDRTLGVRKLNASARELADHYFFETLVRVHRAGEGAPYTGIKPAGRDLGPAVVAGDKALESGSLEQVAKLLTQSMHHNLHQKYEAVAAAKKFKADDVAGGQRYVKAYVDYIHSVERMYDATVASGHGHEAEAPKAGHDH